MAVNAHTHLYSGLVPLGMPAPAREPASFVEILELVWWKLDRALDARTLRASARFYVAESILAGCHGLVDHHESPNFIEGSLDVIADACQDLGMPALLCYGVTERNDGREEAARGIEECRRFIRDNHRPLVKGVIGLHASFTVSDETIRAAAAAARDTGTVLHVHVAEDAADVRDAKERGYAGVIDRLRALDALVPRSIFAHGVHLTQDEVGLVSRAGIWLVQNPRSNRGNKVGYPAWLRRSDNVALGTDGYPARMDEECSELQALAEEHGESASVAKTRLSGSSLLFADVFGRAAEILASESRLCDGRLAGGDLAEIRATAAECAKDLWQRMESL